MQGALETGEGSVGQTAGLIKQVRSAADVIRAIVEGAVPIISRWQHISSQPQAAQEPRREKAQG